MASPVVEQVVTSATATASTSHIVNLPTATAGQLLLIVSSRGSTAANYNVHASVTELRDEPSAGGFYIAYRQMDGTEPASYTLITTAATRSADLAFRISGAENPATILPVLAAAGAGAGTTPNPPSVTPGSSKDYLFIAACGSSGEQADDGTYCTVFPTNYTHSQNEKTCGVAGTNLGGMIAAASRQLTTGSTEDPGTFTVSETGNWITQTIMIHPAPPPVLGSVKTFVLFGPAMRRASRW
jgi:hypothetical protein